MPRTARNLSLVPDNEFPARMRSERARRGLTQAQVADELHVLPQTVSQWELGKKKPQVRHSELLMKFLRLSDEADLQLLLDRPVDPERFAAIAEPREVLTSEQGSPDPLVGSSPAAVPVPGADTGAPEGLSGSNAESPSVATDDYVRRAIADFVSGASGRKLTIEEMEFLRGLRENH